MSFKPGRFVPLVAALIALVVSSASAQPVDPPAPAPPPAQAAPAESPWFHPFAVFVVNANINSKGLLPGSFGVFALPDTNLTHREQFNISPGNSFFGALFVFPKVNETEITAKVDADLRGTTPLDAQNLLQILFIDAYIQLKTGSFTLLAGQAGDVVSPLVPTTLNMFPTSYVPGSIGYFRPQIRVEQSFAAGSDDAVTVQAAMTQAVQTFKVGGESFATQSGWPDVQLRAAFGHGAPGAEGKRPVELGVSGHFGERHLYLSPTQDYFRNSYSFGFDGRAQITKKTKVQGEYFTGQALADYMGGILQSFDPTTGQPVDAQGFWLEGEQALNESTLLHVGYGLDNVEEEKIGLILPRIQNEMFYTNVMHGFSKELSVAGEFAWWRTKYRGLPDASPLRVEVAITYKFAR